MFVLYQSKKSNAISVLNLNAICFKNLRKSKQKSHLVFLVAFVKLVYLQVVLLFHQRIA